MTRRVAGTPCLQIAQDSSTRVRQGLVAEKKHDSHAKFREKKKKKKSTRKEKTNAITMQAQL